MTASLHSSGLLNGDSLPVNLQRVHHGDLKEDGVIHLQSSVDCVVEVAV